MVKFILSLVACILALLAGCTTLPRPESGSVAVPDSNFKNIVRKVEQQNTDKVLDQALPARVLPPLDMNDRAGRTLNLDLENDSSRLYSFRVRNLPVRDALNMFASLNQLNIVVEAGVTGNISASFDNIPLAKAFDLMLTSQGYAFEINDKVIRVREFLTKTFSLDYIRVTRSASSGGSVSSGGGGGGGSQGSISTSNDGQFWSEMDGQLRSMLSPRGRISINRLTGTAQVTDVVPRVREIESFINTVRAGMHRQIDLEVRIAEVTLRDDQALGLDWSRLPINRFGAIRAVTSITDGGGSLQPPPSTLSASYVTNNFSAVITALKQQGDVRVVSQPRVRIINNQTAFVKVGTDQTFFTRTTNRLIQTGGSVVDSINEQANTVTVGVVMTVTPQISNDGYAMLDIAPTMTRLAGMVTSPGGTSSAPILEIKQTNTMVRVKDNEVVVLGGLIQEETSDVNRSVPLVGEIPVLGKAFGSTYKGTVRKELVIFLVPSILPDDPR
jgi:MSHA biogenesis protein MshL